MRSDVVDMRSVIALGAAIDQLMIELHPIIGNAGIARVCEAHERAYAENDPYRECRGGK